MSLAEDARAAVRDRPVLLAALRAGVVNYTAAARALADDVDGDTESVATALRRFAETLSERTVDSRDVRVTMTSGVGIASEGADDPVLAVGGIALAPGAGSLTAVLATGEVDAAALAHVLGRLDAEGADVRAAGLAGEALAVAVERRDGPDALRIAEDALASVPTRDGTDADG
ncbi:DUF7523 family protein [Halorussus marinus]|uniref:DUF7523 family protein n=1 Tax=Halorussus marinus TaxID=2505976 RepID=UPI001092DFCD|nr:hypothetical protein [Halorussus marinus]